MLSYLQKKVDITHLSGFKTPAKAEYFYELSRLEDIEKIYEIYSYAKENNFPVLFITGGTNMLFAFDVYNGVVIKNSLLGWEYNKDTRILKANAAASIWEIAESLENIYKQNLWHRFIGLPGSIAGAVYGNAGCFGLETENNFLNCRVLNLENGQVTIFKKNDMKFDYRTSILKTDKKYFLISAEFDLNNKIEKYHSDIDNIDFRENKQPKGNSCGSFFKNPSKVQSAGSLIESVGLKGYKKGGAYFSEKHANFLMHDGSGNYRDLLFLIDLAQKKVYERFEICLENEVQIISNS